MIRRLFAIASELSLWPRRGRRQSRRDRIRHSYLACKFNLITDGLHFCVNLRGNLYRHASKPRSSFARSFSSHHGDDPLDAGRERTAAGEEQQEKQGDHSKRGLVGERVGERIHN
jgi:hypothetical protein